MPGLSLGECKQALLKIKEITQQLAQEEIDKTKLPDVCKLDFETFDCRLFHFMTSEGLEDKKVVIIRNEKLKPRHFEVKENIIFIPYRVSANYTRQHY